MEPNLALSKAVSIVKRSQIGKESLGSSTRRDKLLGTLPPNEPQTIVISMDLTIAH